jgi:hypothetical protein
VRGRRRTSAGARRSPARARSRAGIVAAERGRAREQAGGVRICRRDLERAAAAARSPGRIVRAQVDARRVAQQVEVVRLDVERELVLFARRGEPWRLASALAQFA